MIIEYASCICDHTGPLQSPLPNPPTQPHMGRVTYILEPCHRISAWQALQN